MGEKIGSVAALAPRDSSQRRESFILASKWPDKRRVSRAAKDSRALSGMPRLPYWWSPIIGWHRRRARSRRNKSRAVRPFASRKAQGECDALVFFRRA